LTIKGNQNPKTLDHQNKKRQEEYRQVVARLRKTGDSIIIPINLFFSLRELMPRKKVTTILIRISYEEGQNDYMAMHFMNTDQQMPAHLTICYFQEIASVVSIRLGHSYFSREEAFCFLAVLGIQPRALHTPGKHSTVELYSPPHPSLL
jgi:hypothetical protein